MKKFISKSFLFILFTVIFYLASIFIWGRFAPSQLESNINYRIGSSGHMYSRLLEVKSYGRVDLLFLGSSHTYRGLDTRIFSKYGYESFNLGSSSQTPAQTKVLLERYLDNLNPKLIIYEVYPVTFEIDGVESSLDLIANDKNDIHSLRMALKINNIKIYNTLLYGFIRDILDLNKSYSQPIIIGNDKYISGGYVESEIGFYQPTEFKEREISLRNYQLESFFEIVQMIKNKNIDLILVYAPITNDHYSSYNNNGYFDSVMKGYSEYYNFNELINLSDTLHFYDSHHLNQNGVKLFNEKLIELLEQR